MSHPMRGISLPAGFPARYLGTGEFEINLSVPLCFEYESIAKRVKVEKQLQLTEKDIEELIEMIDQAANLWEIHFLTRPFLPDPNDELLLELAFTANCDFIITHNLKDFKGVKEHFGI
jgi:predicted nucleic acid-binding protein